jgi:hypothetical protein
MFFNNAKSRTTQDTLFRFEIKLRDCQLTIWAKGVLLGFMSLIKQLTIMLHRGKAVATETLFFCLLQFPMWCCPLIGR